MKQKYQLIVLLICLLGILCLSCSDSSTDNTPQPVTYELLASHCDPLTISVAANQRVTITTTDTVITHVDGSVVDCDFWCDADGIPTCHYVGQQPDLHDLSFMALIGTHNDDWFLIGTSFDSTFTTAGTIEMKVNDWGPCGDDSDNAGRFMITVLKH